MGKTILLADGDSKTCHLLDAKLSFYGYVVITVSNGEEALRFFDQEKPHLVLLDVMLPKIDGYKVCNELRKISSTPIILFSALDTLTDRIIGFNLGADDYIVKPFSIDELEIRIQSLIRRSHFNDCLKPLFIYVGELTLNLSKRYVIKNDQLVKLTSLEFSLLEVLISKPGKIITRSDIFSILWGYAEFRYVDTRVVDVYICRLRSKLEKDPNNPTLILTIRGKGYMFHEIKH